MATTGGQIAAQLYSVRSIADNEKSAAKTLKELRKIGYRNVQISGTYCAFDPKATREMCDAAGVKVIGAHVGLGEMRSDLGAIIEKLRVWGCNYVAIPHVAKTERDTLAKWKKIIRDAKMISKKLAKHGIVLQYHNHAFEFEQFGRKNFRGGRTALDLIYSSTTPKELQAELDTCWVARGGANPVDWILRVKGRMDQIHCKDTVIHDDNPVFCSVGEGNLNWPAIIKACKSIKVKDYIVEQDSFVICTCPLKSFEISYNNLRKFGLK